MTPTCVPRRWTDYTIEEMEGETLLYRPPLNQAVYLNQTASIVWKLCDGTRTMQEIIDILIKEFPDALEIRSDVASALEDLARLDVIALTSPENTTREPATGVTGRSDDAPE